ncbi:MAG TPA: putative zinc-binding metallopeptidase, partial [Polyangiaceae bacterium]
LVYGLNRLKLPLSPKGEDEEDGLAFDIKADTEGERVLTGHSDGLITLNLGEADAATREKMRASMRERYRTLLGHFRHEVGHYYFRLLVEKGGPIDDFRALFGDERADYGEALKAHYEKGQGAPSDAFISAYASAHPWEDFAETFAHYLHMIDTLETAHHVGVTLGSKGKPADGSDLDALLVEWGDLAIAMNMLNRSMGLADAYPFAITAPVRAKLGFVHRLVREHGNPRAAVRAPARPLTAAGSA